MPALKDSTTTDAATPEWDRPPDADFWGVYQNNNNDFHLVCLATGDRRRVNITEDDPQPVVTPHRTNGHGWIKISGTSMFCSQIMGFELVQKVADGEAGELHLEWVAAGATRLVPVGKVLRVHRILNFEIPDVDALGTTVTIQMAFFALARLFRVYVDIVRFHAALRLKAGRLLQNGVMHSRAIGPLPEAETA